MTCTVEGCDRPGSPLCPMHRKRQQRGADLHAPEQERLSPWERLIAAATAVADADSDEPFSAEERDNPSALDLHRIAASMTLETVREARARMEAANRSVRG